MDKFNLWLDDALNIIIIAALILFASIMLFKDIEYNARLMHNVNIEQGVSPDCSPIEE